MNLVDGRDRAPRFAVMVGFVVVGMAVALGVFIQYQAREPHAPENIPRAVAIPALYATIGALAMTGAIQRRPAIIVAAGLLCLVGSLLSVATIAFGVPGVVLVLLGSRIRAVSRRYWLDAIIAAATIPLILGAASAVLGMTEERCWQATGSRSNPTYAVIPCGGQSVVGTDGQPFASGADSGVLTRVGGLVEGVLLLGALSLTAFTGSAASSRSSP